MRYFKPRFKIATLSGEQDKLFSKIGGAPWGLPSESWPYCCGYPEKLLAQLCDEPQVIDLGDSNAVLHLFQCLECGGIDECGRDAFLLDRSQLCSSLVRIPGYDQSPELGDRLIGEFWIEGWDEDDDGISAARLPEFFLEKDLWALQEEYPQIKWFDGREQTRFGGSPRWTGNGPMGFPPPPFEFLLQLDNYLYLDGSPPTPNEVGCGITEFNETERHPARQVHVRPDESLRKINAPWNIMHEYSANYYYAEYTNFGSDGTAFVFVDRTRQPCKFVWFWIR